MHASTPHWAADFQALARVLSSALDGLEVAIAHVGSTAVPGLAAKPIIDLDLAYAPAVPWAALPAALTPLGYVHVGDQGLAGREVFKRPGGGPPHPVLDRIVHHLYACPANGAEYQRHVQFRDFLRHDEPTRRRYEALKRQLAAEAGQDAKRYAALKQVRARAFVAEVLEQAQRQRGGPGPRGTGQPLTP
ncbi:GrpB family protein [Hymenobacter sp. NST-14]|uniref:GrpB family protein n=1 Tax=Hymenobacter piscis TaxID=2839984 RepID=UPI001C02A425|nr:GrpB family protein [Hymenobacter piscis]MBT9395243.1 GrpB family protein [Hymenobacter piscis]